MQDDEDLGGNKTRYTQPCADEWGQWERRERSRMRAPPAPLTVTAPPLATINILKASLPASCSHTEMSL